MNIYLYCSYEHSQYGFFLSSIEENGLQPVHSWSTVPKCVTDFFSYDRFQILWRDLSAPQTSMFAKHEITGGFLGIRNMNGHMADGRKGTVNIAFFAEAHELTELRRVALSVFGDYGAFVGKIFGLLTVGGECSYQLDTAAFQLWLGQCTQNNKLKKLRENDDAANQLLVYMQERDQVVVEPQLLHFAVSTSDWKTIYKTMGEHKLWYFKPKCVITIGEFEQIFRGQGPLWELYKN